MENQYLLRIDRLEPMRARATLIVLRKNGSSYLSSNAIKTDDGSDLSLIVSLIYEKFKDREPLITIKEGGQELFWTIEEDLGEALFNLANILPDMEYKDRLVAYESVSLFTLLKAGDWCELNKKVKTWKLTLKLRGEKGGSS